jgi:hypothetical protein
VGTGTYTLTQDIITASSTCFSVLANGVIFDGSGYSITGSGGTYGFYARSGNQAFGTTTLQNVTVSGFGDSIYTQAGSNLDSGSVVILNSNLEGFVTTQKVEGNGLPGHVSLSNSILNGNILSRSGGVAGATVLISNSTINGYINNRYESSTLAAQYIEILNSTVTGYIDNSSIGWGLSGGTIYIATSTVANIISNGGQGLYSGNFDGSVGGVGGHAGTTTLINSHSTDITSTGGYGAGIGVACGEDCDPIAPNTRAGSGGQGGYVELIRSTLSGTINVSGGLDFQDQPLLPGDGGDGGTVIITESSVATTTASGRDASGNGGNGGTITLTYASSTGLLASNGGNSTSCGNGGNGGTINVSNESSYGSISIQGGSGTNSGCVNESTSGGLAGQNLTFTAPPRSVTQSVTQSTTDTTNTSNGTSLTNLINRDITNPLNLTPLPSFNFFDSEGQAFTPNFQGSTVIPYPFRNFAVQSPLQFIPSPKFNLNISTFLFAPLPNTITDALASAPRLSSFIAAAGVSNEQSLAQLSAEPLPLTLGEGEYPPPGHFVIKSGEETLTTYATYDTGVGGLAELVKVSPNQLINISLVPLSTGVVTATYLDQVLTFTLTSDSYTTNITTPANPGRYVLKTASSPVTLLIDVVAPVVEVVPETKPWGIFNFVWEWFN